MLIISCMQPNPYLRLPVNEKDIVLTLRRYLAIMYEMAVEERNLHPVRPRASLQWFRKSSFFGNFHECFYRLKRFYVVTEQRAGMRCQECSLMKAMRMVALSQYSRRCDDFISRYPDDGGAGTVARVNFDWAGAFAEFFQASGLPVVFWSVPQRIIRAVRFCSVLNEIGDARTSALAEPDGYGHAAPSNSSCAYLGDEDIIEHALEEAKRRLRGRFRFLD